MDHNLSPYGVVAIIVLATILGHSAGRDLRPSDHGLTYQLDTLPPPSPNEVAQEARSFFGATTSSPSVQLPEAKNISDTWLNTQSNEGARDDGISHVRLGLLAATAVCGLTGVVLLAISGVVFVYRLQKRRPKGEGISSTSALASESHAVDKSSG